MNMSRWREAKKMNMNSRGVIIVRITMNTDVLDRIDTDQMP